MKVLVAYASRLGSTVGIAERIASRLRSHGLDASAEEVAAVGAPVGYDAFVVGSGVYAGHWLKEATAFVDRNSGILATGPVWLFSSGPVGERAAHAAPIEASEVRELKDVVRARDHRVFAGALDRRAIDDADFGFAERFVAKRFVPEGDFRDWPQIDGWADEIAAELMPASAGRT